MEDREVLEILGSICGAEAPQVVGELFGDSWKTGNGTSFAFGKEFGQLVAEFPELSLSQSGHEKVRLEKELQGVAQEVGPY
jgi:hypothetical protein